jgi:hypothetical protein
LWNLIHLHLDPIDGQNQTLVSVVLNELIDSYFVKIPSKQLHNCNLVLHNLLLRYIKRTLSSLLSSQEVVSLNAADEFIDERYVVVSLLEFACEHQACN